MLISEFSRRTGLSADTVRFYVRKGLIRPDTTAKGGSNPYQIFRPEHVGTARLIRLAQSLGFSLREIAAFGEDFRTGATTPGRGQAILEAQLAAMEAKAADLADIIGYMRAKIDWLKQGGRGPEPGFPALRPKDPVPRPATDETCDR